MPRISGVRQGTWLKSEVVPEDVSDIIRNYQHEKESSRKPRPNTNQAVYAMLRELEKMKKEEVK